MEEQQIVQLLLSRDQAAIGEIEKRYGTKLHLLALKILRNREDAEESVNDTYLKAWDTIPPQIPQFLFAYLAKICRFIAFGKLDWKNAKKRNAQIVELTAELELCIPNVYIESMIEGREIGRLLNEFLSKISEEQRLIFMRRYWFSDSIHEISERYHISESKVKTSLYRTRKRLKHYLESEGIRL